MLRVPQERDKQTHIRNKKDPLDESGEETGKERDMAF